MKKPALICLIILLTIAASACGNKTDIAAEDVLTAIFQAVPEDELPTLIETDSSMLESYYGLTEAECADYAGRFSLFNTSATELIVVRAEKNAAGAVAAAFTERKSELLERRSAESGQRGLVEDARIVQNGDWVLFVIAERAYEIVSVFTAQTTTG